MWPLRTQPFIASLEDTTLCPVLVITPLACASLAPRCRAEPDGATVECGVEASLARVGKCRAAPFLDGRTANDARKLRKDDVAIQDSGIQDSGISNKPPFYISWHKIPLYLHSGLSRSSHLIIRSSTVLA